MSRSDVIAAEGQQIKLKMGVQMEHNVQKRLAMAVKVALGVSTGLAFYGANSFAEEDASSIEEVVVTGSRIKQADFDNANPVTVISREDLLVTGMTDVGDLIQRLPLCRDLRLVRQQITVVMDR